MAAVKIARTMRMMGQRMLAWPVASAGMLAESPGLAYIGAVLDIGNSAEAGAPPGAGAMKHMRSRWIWRTLPC
jgi:hypothetical protein